MSLIKRSEMKEFFHLINGKRWLISPVNKRLQSCKGECDIEHRQISISHKLRGVLKIDTVIHESLHAALPHQSEEWVNQVASDIAGLLYKMNVRVIEE